MANEALDKLVALSTAGNFLDSLGELGKILEEQKKQDTLVQVYQKFLGDKEKLETTGAQLANVQGKYEEQTKESPIPDYTSTVQRLTNSLKTIKAYKDLYFPVMQAFSILGGDEGVRFANVLNNELASRIKDVEAEMNIPYQALQLQSLVGNIEHNRLLIDKLTTDRNFQEQVMKIAGEISQHELFRKMPKGAFTFTDYDKITKLSTIIDSIVHDIRTKYGEEISSDVISAALKRTFDFYGIDIRFSQIQDTAGVSDKLTPLELAQVVGTLQGLTIEWNNYSDDAKKAFREYLENPKDALSTTNAFQAEQLKEMVRKFGPTGQYATLYSLLSGSMKESELSKYPIIRLSNFDDFINDSFKYNPKDLYNENIRKGEVINNLLNNVNPFTSNNMPEPVSPHQYNQKVQEGIQEIINKSRENKR